jgi:hypothetical protein
MDNRLPMKHEFRMLGICSRLWRIRDGFLRASRLLCLLSARRTYWIVAIGLHRVPYVPLCSHCLAATDGGRRELGPGNTGGVVIPYCESCLLKIGQSSVGAMAWMLASMTSGVAASLFLPMLPWIAEGTAIGGAFVFAVLPLVLGQVWGRRQEQHPSFRGKAVFAITDGLACLNPEWASRLSNCVGAEVQKKRLRVKSRAVWAYIGTAIALLATHAIYGFFHSFVRILNLTDDVLMVSVDEHRLANVPSTSSENPLAGLLIRVPTGRRRFLAHRVDGTLVDQVTADVFTARSHLYAPGRPKTVCFWLEHTSLGRSQWGNAKREGLARKSSFWSIQDNIDVWFGPAYSSGATRLTGGVVTALRQGPCRWRTGDAIE